jgi:hypothetical protein
VQVRAQGEVIAAELMNISHRGMFVRARLAAVMDSLKLAALLAPGASLAFRLRLSGHTAACEASGRVAWKSDHGIGLDFVEVSQPLYDFIQQLTEAADQADALLATVEPDPSVDVR